LLEQTGLRVVGVNLKKLSHERVRREVSGCGVGHHEVLNGMRLLNAVSQCFPHGGELAWQPRQGAKVNAAFIGAVEIAAA
jgi:hypothetical protein